MEDSPAGQGNAHEEITGLNGVFRADLIERGHLSRDSTEERGFGLPVSTSRAFSTEPGNLSYKECDTRSQECAH